MSGGLVQVASYDLPGYAFDVWGDGQFLYLSNGNDGLYVLSFDPVSKVITEHFHLTPSGACVGAWADDLLLYIAGHTEGVYKETVGSGGSLSFEGTDTPSGDYRLGVWGESRGSKRFYFVASYEGGLHVYQTFSDKTTSHIDSDTTGDRARGVHSDGQFIYLANGTTGLHVYSMSDNGYLTHLDSYNPGGEARRIWTDGNFVYVGCYNGGLHVFSVDGSGNITHRDSYSSGNSAHEAWGVWASGGYVYCAYKNYGLCVFSVDGNGSLTLLECCESMKYPRGVWSDGDYLYAAMSTPNSGLEIWAGYNVSPFKASWAQGINRHIGVGLGV